MRASAEPARRPASRPPAPAPDPPRSSVPSARDVRRRLLGWYRRHRRDLPWRATADPYAVLVSEVMLQQTTVRAVVPYYREFLRRFPDWESLARAPEEGVLAAWSGLGYYARARNLRRTAREIVGREGGRFPRDLRRARALPGVGPYTAGAVLSIACGLPEPAIDGNAARAISRLCRLRGDVRRPGVLERMRAIAAGWIPRRSPGNFNQALMELGATVCTPRAPRCPVCPLRAVCAARAAGLEETLPERTPPAPPVGIESAAVLIRDRGRVLLARRDGAALLGGLWELPGTLPDDLASVRNGRGAPRGGGSARRLRGRLARRLSLRVEILRRLGEIRHTITRHRIRLILYEGRLLEPPPRGEWLWTDPRRLDGIAAGAATVKLLRRCSGARPPTERASASP